MRAPNWLLFEADRLQDILESRNGSAFKYGENDCWTFVISVLCEVIGLDMPTLPHVHSSVSGKKREKCRELVKQIFPGGQLIVAPFFQVWPGDILIRETRSAIHLSLAGPKQSHVWTCSEKHGVCRKGWEKVDSIYRLEKINGLSY